MQWLVRVEMFSQNECLVKNTLAVSCVKNQERGALPPFADVHEHITLLKQLSEKDILLKNTFARKKKQ